VARDEATAEERAFLDALIAFRDRNRTAAVIAP
jgi:hypothetical protein